LPKLDGLVVGELIGFTNNLEPLVQCRGNPLEAPLPARAILDLDADAIGREVVLMFEGGDATRPVVLGILRDRLQPSSARVVSTPATLGSAGFEAEIDGERLEIRAKREIAIRVGKASIVLTHDGKVLIRGEYLLSRSSGPNRIRGGSVELN
jgi:hypothetical protein